MHVYRPIASCMKCTGLAREPENQVVIKFCKQGNNSLATYSGMEATVQKRATEERDQTDS